MDTNISARYNLRPLTPVDQSFLWEMLYQSLYIPAGKPPFDRAVLHQLGIAKYVKDWGREKDAGFAAVDKNNRPVGAVWMRLERV